MMQWVPILVAWSISGIHLHHEEFLRVLLSSWRIKTNISYNSKCASWCKQRNRYPTGRPVEDVVNFLVKLYAEGYPYRSIC